MSWMMLSLMMGMSISVAAQSKDNHAVQFQAILDAAVNDGMKAVSAQISWGEGSWAGVERKTSSDSGKPLSSESPLRLASITKLFTATLILQLADEKVLQLDDTLVFRRSLA